MAGSDSNRAIYSGRVLDCIHDLRLIGPAMIRSDAMRRSAMGEDCTFQIAGVCNGNPETTVLCHLPDESHGMGRKSDDIAAAYGCSACHDVIDCRNSHNRPKSDDVGHNLDWYMRRAMVRTWRRMVETGVVSIKGYKP